MNSRLHFLIIDKADFFEFVGVKIVIWAKSVAYAILPIKVLYNILKQTPTNNHSWL